MALTRMCYNVLLQLQHIHQLNELKQISITLHNYSN